MTRKLSLVAGLLLCASPALAIVDWDNPRDPRGFMPNTPVYADGNGSDATSPFSGGVGLTIPIGQPFHVGGGLTWQLSLSYSSSIWRYTVSSNQAQGEFVKAEIDNDYNSGVGWWLSLGKLYKPMEGGNGPDWVYVSPSGSRHKFFQQLHSSDSDGDSTLLYTRDGTYLRLKSSSTTPRIEFPDGTRHSFD